MTHPLRLPTRTYWCLLSLALSIPWAAPSAPAHAALSYTVEANGWPNAAHRDAAVAAIQTVVNRYNAYGDFGNNNVYVYYNAGIPTAQASYNGSIGFGGTYPNERVMAHEMAHYRGLPSGNWSALMSGGTWDGVLGLNKVRQLDGEQATLNGDGAHFWPYGLNFDSEGGELNKQRQVEVVYAIRADLGIGSSTPPGSNRTVTLVADNPAGESGFNFKNQWSDGYTPHTNAVYNTDDYLLRTPASSNTYRFYGGALVVDNTDGASGGLHYYGQSTSSLVIIDDLRLDGGWVQHTSSAGTRFRLDGNVNVQTNSTFRAKQGNIDVLADVTGAGDLTIETTDLPDTNDRYVRFLSSNNTFVGDVVNLSRFELAAGANFRFAIGPGGATNTITGPAARATLLNGAFDLDLSAASANAGDSWALVTAANTTYGGNFQVNDFENLDGYWSNGSYSFSQATGLLTLVPAWNVNGGGAWSTVGNWTGGVPPANGEATFGPVLTAPNTPASVNVDAPVTLQRLTFDNPNQYVLAGANPITLTGGALVVAKSGSQKISVPIAGNSGFNVSGDGILELTAASSYSGDTNIKSGKLRLSGAATIASTASIRVHHGATLDVAPLATGLQLGSGQSLDTNGTVEGNVVASAGAMISGNGIHAGHVNARTGSIVRVGAATLSSAASANGLAAIDDFQSYTAGKLNAGATGGIWSGVFDGTENAQIVNDTGNNSLEYYGTGSAWRGAQTSLANSFSPDDHSLANGDKATYFFRVQRRGNQTIDSVFGLTDLDSIGTDAPWSELAITMSLFQGTATGDTTALRAYDGDGSGDVLLMNNIGANEWINVWLVVDNQTKTYQVATSLGTDGGSLFPNTFQFGRQGAAGAALDTFAGAENRAVSGGRNSSAVRIDDLFRLDWNDLSNPLGIVGETLTIDGDLTLEGPTATLQLNLGDPDTHDRLVVTGIAQLAGVLEVDLQAGFSLAAGQVFDLFDFATTLGSFEMFDLPTLGANLRWDVSQLAATGAIAVAAGLDGDFNADGIVDAADYTHWRDNLGAVEDAVALAGNGSRDGIVNDADYLLWKSNFGATVGGATVGGGAMQTTQIAVPEPVSLVLFAAGLAIIALRRSN